MGLLFFALMYAPAILTGAGYIANPWMIVSILSAWVWSIFAKSQGGSVDYKALDSHSFIAKNNEINKSTLLRLVVIGVIYGIAYLFR